MNEQSAREKLKSQLEQELAHWQTKIDEARVQMHLGARDVQDRIHPYVEELELELDKVRGQWNRLESASEGAWDDISHGLDISVKAMKQAFDRAKAHFPGKED